MQNSLDYAYSYYRQQWMPIYLPSRSKKPGRINWQNERLKEEDLPTYFSKEVNIGLLLGEPSNGLCDVDLDCKEAVILAREFLPETCRKSGRETSPQSHWWYYSKGLATCRYEDTLLRGSKERAMIVEIRSNGGHTLVPPSIHPSGDKYIWNEEGEPAEVSNQLLLSSVSKLAACSLIVRHWIRGKRHNLALALAATLLRSGWSIEDVKNFIVAAGRTAGDEELNDRQQAIRDTYKRLLQYESITGFSRLSELLPKDIIESVTKWLNLPKLSIHAQALELTSLDERNIKIRPSKATLLITLASEVELFHTPDGEAFGRIQVNGHYEVWPLRSKSFRKWLSHRFFTDYEKAPGSQPLMDALTVLEGKALFSGPERNLNTRLAEYEGAVYLDLANNGWNAIEITPGQWRIVDSPPVFFRRTAGMLPLPEPIPCNSIEILRQFINIRSDESWALLMGWLIGAFSPRGPYPLLVLHGEQGSAKSTTARVLRSLIDPNSAGLRSEPRDARDLMIAAKNGWVISLDNLSSMSVWLSDALCRLSTGGAFATRELYSDADEVLFEAKRPVILNGIEELATRGDLLDRSMIIYLPAISEDIRKPESLFWKEFEHIRPQMLGALLSAVGTALGNNDSIKLARLPRLADFAIWATAAESALGLSSNQFINAYTNNREAANSLALDASPVAAALISMTEEIKAWSGTATQLLGELNERVDDNTRKQQGWPRRSNTLSNKLRRLAPNLRAMGVELQFVQEGHKKTRLIEVQKIVERPSASPAGQQLYEEKQDSTGGLRGQAGDFSPAADNLLRG